VRITAGCEIDQKLTRASNGSDDFLVGLLSVQYNSAPLSVWVWGGARSVFPDPELLPVGKTNPGSDLIIFQLP
jgi:hypothetical protein